VLVIPEKDNYLNVQMTMAIDLNEVIVVGYQVPLTEQDNTVQGMTLTLAEIKRHPSRVNSWSRNPKAAVITSKKIKGRSVRGVKALGASTTGISSVKEGESLSIRSSRSNATNYHLDGIRISGREIPQQQWEKQVRLAGGTPAAFANQAAMQEALAKDKRLATKLDKVNYRSGQSVLLKGKHSIQNKNLLYILDGKIVNKKDMDKLKFNKIKNTQVLTKEIAIPIYGQKAKYGVLFVNTKKRSETSQRLAGERQLKLVLNKLKTEGEELFLEYRQQEQLLGAKLQIGDVDLVDLSKKNQTLTSQRNQHQKVMQQLGLLDNILGTKSDKQAKSKHSTLFNQYQYALNFKNGTYNPRQFYTPKYTAKTPPKVREDFRKTIYWNSNIVADENGKATVEFYNSDASTTFKAIAEGIGLKGRIGRGEMTYFIQQQLAMLAKIPSNLITGDVVEIPVTISNNSNEKMVGTLTSNIPSGLHLLDIPAKNLKFLPKESKTILLKYQILDEPEKLICPLFLIVKMDGRMK
jgi:hypothetical protein